MFGIGVVGGRASDEMWVSPALGVAVTTGVSAVAAVRGRRRARPGTVSVIERGDAKIAA